MTRLEPVVKTDANQETVKLLDNVKRKMGRVPNLIATMANSTPVANAYLGFSQALSAGSLQPKLREQIALTVGEANSCGYCVAAHTAIGKSVGLSETATVAARRGRAEDDKEQAALNLASEIVAERGYVSDDTFHAARQAGYTDGEIAEIVANVALNLFTNYFNHVAKTEIDFPSAQELSAA